MKNSFYKKIAIITGSVLGAFAITVLAQTAWVNPPGAPPDCPLATTYGCNVPVNVGDISQSKTGFLGLKSFAFKPTSANVTVGNVLTATAVDGTVGWAAPAGSGGGGGFSNAVEFTSTQNWTVPAGVTKLMVEVWGGGGGGAYTASGCVNNAGGGSGGGGGYGMKIITNPSSQYTVTIGTFGAAGAFGVAATDGGGTTFGPVSATGGSAGVGAPSASVGGAGGAGGLGQGGLINRRGGTGSDGSLVQGVGYALGGSGANGGMGGASVGSIGIQPGGGGAAGSCTVAANRGAVGRVVVWY